MDCVDYLCVGHPIAERLNCGVPGLHESVDPLQQLVPSQIHTNLNYLKYKQHDLEGTFNPLFSLLVL
jgi:hypothetical protein